MAIELYRLIKKVKQMDITLVAGEQGTKNLVSWVYMVENEVAADFLSGGELVFMTGIGLSDDKDLENLVKCIASHNTAGVVINTGPYIEEISKEIIEFGDTQGFPVYVVPWKIHLAEIMRVISYSITREEQRLLETAAAFKNAIYFPKQEELYVVPLSQRNFQVNWCYCACVINLNDVNGRLNERIESVCISIENSMRHYYTNFALFRNEAEIVLVCANMSEQEVSDFVNMVRQRLSILLMTGEKMTLGVGRLTKSIRCLYKSYHQAKAIQRLQTTQKIGTDRIFYGTLGVYRLLMGIEDKSIMQDYYDRTLRPLVEYDEVNKTDLCETLNTYLNNDGSVNKTAEELFVHRNTINYKLHKVEEILNIELSSLNTRMELMLAFALQNIL